MSRAVEGTAGLEGLGQPGERTRAEAGTAPSGTATVHLVYQAPFRFDELLAFFRERALAGVELVGEERYARAVRLDGPGGAVAGWVRVEDDASHSRLAVTMPVQLAPYASQIAARVRRMFDADCCPQEVAAGLHELERTLPGSVVEGVRLPGCFDPFETACRAVLGQQVSVAAANKLAARIVERYGTPVETGVAGLTHVFPTPADILALDPIEDALGPLGVIKTRSRVIAQLAAMLESGVLDFSPSALATEQIEKLLAVKGIGPWTANYIAMRALSHPDAFLESDAGVAKALPDMTPKQKEQLAQAWRPWRSYAVISLWNSLAHNPTPNSKPKP